MKSKQYSPNVQAWIKSRDQAWTEARKNFRLSEAHVQMAKELGLNPKKFGKIGNSKQGSWKMPLPDFIEYLHEKRFSKLYKDKNKATRYKSFLSWLFFLSNLINYLSTGE